MIVKFINVQRRHGTSSKTGQPYDICTVEYGVPIEPRKTDAYTFLGYGLSVKEIRCDPACMDSFKEIDSLSEIDLILQPDAYNPERNIVVGHKK